MKKAAAELNFEAAAEYRDKLIMLKKHIERRKIKAYNIRKQFGGTQIMLSLVVNV